MTCVYCLTTKAEAATTCNVFDDEGGGGNDVYCFLTTKAEAATTCDVFDDEGGGGDDV